MHSIDGREKSMKTLYALVFVCLSLPALADVLDVMPIGADEEITAAVNVPALQPVDDQTVGAVVDEDNAGSVTTPNDVASVTTPNDAGSVTAANDVASITTPNDAEPVTAANDAEPVTASDVGSVTTPAMEPVDEPELQGASRDHDPMVDNDASAASPTPLAQLKVGDEPVSLGLELSAADEAPASKLPATVGEASAELDICE
jgi:hypothetical protein